MSDLISRQEVINALVERTHLNWETMKILHPALGVIDNLPSAHPEIVRCKDCKWYELPSHKISENCVRWMKSNGILLPIKPNDYCSMAERRKDGSD